MENNGQLMKYESKYEMVKKTTQRAILCMSESE